MMFDATEGKGRLEFLKQLPGHKLSKLRNIASLSLYPGFMYQSIPAVNIPPPVDPWKFAHHFARPLGFPYNFFALGAGV